MPLAAEVLRILNDPQSMTTATRRILAAIKASKLKVQAAVQGDAVRITGAKRDDLQAAIALVRKEMAELPLSFTNFRE